MIVARQFIAWSVPHKEPVPPGRFAFFGRIPGNKLPGYDHPVHPGQSPVRPSGTTNLPDNCPQNRSHPSLCRELGLRPDENRPWGQLGKPN